MSVTENGQKSLGDNTRDTSPTTNSSTTTTKSSIETIGYIVMGALWELHRIRELKQD